MSAKKFKCKKKFEDLVKVFLFKNFRKIGIKKNDVIYLSVDIKNFYQPFLKFFIQNKNILNEKYLCELLFKYLKEYFLPHGTIVFPGFTWSFIKTKKFNIKSTPPELGLFEKNIYNKLGVKRSLHPTNSILSIGKLSQTITKDHGTFSFGANSPFDKFSDLHLKFVNIGIPFFDSCTYTHHIEHINGTNHRFYKLIDGKIYANNKILDGKYFILVKYKYFDKLIQRNEKRLYDFLLRKKKVRSIIDKNVIFSNISSAHVLYYGLKMLKNNPTAFMKRKILINFIENKRRFLKRQRSKINFKLV